MKTSAHGEDAKFCLATSSQIKPLTRRLKKLGAVGECTETMRHRRRRAVKFGVLGEGAQ
jgi:hypothetical protein